MLKKLTIKQKQIIDIALKEKPSSYRELGKRLGITRQGVYDRVKRLREKGYLKEEGIIATQEGISSIIERELL